MKKYILSILIGLMLIFGVQYSQAATHFYGATSLLGGISGSLDNIDGAVLADGDGAYVITSTTYYIYYLDASAGGGESSPGIISPDDNAGDKRWLLIFQSTVSLAHKNTHDPDDGSDKLDTDNAAEISVVVGAGVGSSHSFARSDHVHAINHAITTNHIATYDGTQTSGEIVRMTTDGLESRTDGEMKTQLAYLQAGDANNMADALLTRAVLKDYGETVKVHGSLSGATNANLEDGNVHTFEVGGAFTLSLTNPPTSGVEGSITFIITNGSSSILTWDPDIDWPGGTAPDLTTSGVDAITCFTLDEGVLWSCFIAGLDIKDPV